MRERIRLPTGWLSRHYLHRRSIELGALVLLAAVLQISAAVGMAYVAGFSEVASALTRMSWPWLVVSAAAIGLSFVCYYFAYRGIYEVEGGPRLEKQQLRAVVAGGFGGFLAHGGSALDDYALRAAGAEERDATVRVSALAGMEHGVLAILGTAAGITVLALGLSKPPLDFSISWSVLPIPGFAIAFWAAERYRENLRDRDGWRGKMGVFLDAIHLNRLLFLRLRDHGAAVAGMTLFWLTDAFAMWAGLAAFGFHMNPAPMFIGYATGMVFTRRTGPLGGAGVLMVVLPVTLWVSGAPLAVAVVAVFAYRVLSLWLPMPFAFASLSTLRHMGEPGAAHAEQEADAPGEPALRRTPA
jgi:uncharacterized membrane protein YbhN (UPF0104 family)